jgi:hypothetical protein
MALIVLGDRVPDDVALLLLMTVVGVELVVDAVVLAASNMLAALCLTPVVAVFDFDFAAAVSA